MENHSIVNQIKNYGLQLKLSVLSGINNYIDLLA